MGQKKAASSRQRRQYKLVREIAASELAGWHKIALFKPALT